MAILPSQSVIKCVQLISNEIYELSNDFQSNFGFSDSMDCHTLVAVKAYRIRDRATQLERSIFEPQVELAHLSHFSLFAFHELELSQACSFTLELSFLASQRSLVKSLPRAKKEQKNRI